MLEDREAARAERQANLATLQHLAQIATNKNNNGGNGNEEPQNKLGDFQNSNPPTFSKSTEPLDADDWLQNIENKLEYARVGANEKVLYATHFLAGAAGAWWENVRAMQPKGQVMTWEAFKTKFCKAHIPSGLIKIMRDKFLNLKQGGMALPSTSTSSPPGKGMPPMISTLMRRKGSDSLMDCRRSCRPIL
jgi:hypothetical protein